MPCTPLVFFQMDDRAAEETTAEFTLTPEYIASLSPYVRAILALTRVFCDAHRKLEKRIESEKNWQETCTRAATDPVYFPVVSGPDASSLGRLLDLQESTRKSAENVARDRETQELLLEVLVLLQHAKDEYVASAFAVTPFVPTRRGPADTVRYSFSTRRFGVLPLPRLVGFYRAAFGTSAHDRSIDVCLEALYTLYGDRSVLGDINRILQFDTALGEFKRGQTVLRDLESNPAAFLHTIEHL